MSSSIFAFIGVDRGKLPDFDDAAFAMTLLEHKHVLVAPGSSFNVAYRDHFRITTLPEPEVLRDVFDRIEAVLETMA